MTKWEVTGTEWEGWTYQVEAETAEEAEKKARKLAKQHPGMNLSVESVREVKEKP